MKNSKKIILFAYFGIILVLLFMFTATYAFFTVNITGSGSQITASSFDENMELTFNDTSNLTLVNAYTGESITKTFTVTNTGDRIVYYNVLFSELVNNFADPNDLVYTIIGSDGGRSKEQAVVPSVDSPLLGNVEIAPDVTHSYTLTVTFLKTGDDQSNNMNKTFSTKIDISSGILDQSLKLYSNNTLGLHILDNNTAISDEGVNFANVPGTNGLYYTNNSVDGGTVFYFRGNINLNNNVIFGGFCWKIIRTTEDLGIRMIYNGTPVGNTCVNTTEVSTNTTTSVYNSNYSYNAHVGYKFGSPNSASYASEHANTNNSTIKSALETWFTANLDSYSSYIDDSYYCNNRKTVSYTIDSILYSNKGYSNNNTGYNSYYRLKQSDAVIPNLNCSNNDLLTVSNERGVSSSLGKSVGLITADEAVLAGIPPTVNNTSSYLYNNHNYWTMTPAYYFSNKAYAMSVTTSGNLTELQVNTSTNQYIRPVITLKKETVLLSGNGSSSTPYRVTN